MDKTTRYYGCYVLDWIEHRNAWRLYREEKPLTTIAYVDDPEEVKERPELHDLYETSADGIEIEMCSSCMSEIGIRWNINKDGFHAVCPICGSRMMLCDACQHRHGGFCDDCDYDSELEACRFFREGNWWARMIEEG